MVFWHFGLSEVNPGSLADHPTGMGSWPQLDSAYPARGV